MESHVQAATPLAAGLNQQAGMAQPFAATQACWRFLSNPRVTLPELAEPLRESARRHLASSVGDCVLLLHDWSMIQFPTHPSKADRLIRTHEFDIGTPSAGESKASSSFSSPPVSHWSPGRNTAVTRWPNVC